MTTTIKRQTPRNLKEFYDLMKQTGYVRREAVEHLWAGKDDLAPRWIASLEAALVSLDSLPRPDPRLPYRRSLLLPGGGTMDVDLDYEFQELEKDLVYLRQGETGLLRDLANRHPGFPEQIEQGLAKLNSLAFNVFITDRDGTVNNYCGRYRSSIQSAYNALFLARFARTSTRRPVILTSAPLGDGGLLDVSVTPPGAFILAASKGREFLDQKGRHHRKPLEPHQEELLAELNRRLAQMIRLPGYEAYGLVGSGLQFKFGQTTIARQDISRSIPENESLRLLDEVCMLARELDPEEETFRIEDTGLDIEIIVTIHDQSSGLKDFDKGDAVRYLDKTLEFDLEQGPHLVCGDTASDLPMLQAVAERCPDTWAVFVTTKDELAREVLAVCPWAFIASQPDVLVTLLRKLADGKS